MSDIYGKKVSKALLVISAAVLTVAVTVPVLAHIYAGDTIRKGITIERTDVSWLPVKDAEKLVTEDMTRNYVTDKITFTYGGQKWDVRLQDIDYRFLVGDAVWQAYSMARTGNVMKKLYDSVLLSINGRQLKVKENYDSDKLKDILNKIKKECDTTGENAGISYVNGEISFKREKLFRNLNIDRNMELIENRLRKRDFGDIALQAEEKKPDIIYDELKAINGIISNFTTQFNKNDVNRTDNIRLACSRINKRILLPGDSFSMNNALGPRTLENGYKEAPIIFKNELVPGTGGGVCQVSSTLYNTALLAGLDVIEREHHSMPLNYISPGRDATITEDSIDFRFVNSLNSPICLVAGVNGNKLNISILGKKREDGVSIRLKTETLAVYEPKPYEVVLDETLQQGERVVERKAMRGVRVVLYREFYKNGELQWRQRLTEDYYKPVQGKIRVGADLHPVYHTLAE